MNHDPFSEFTAPHYNAPVKQPSTEDGGKGILIFLGITALVLFLFCGGFGAIGFIALQPFAGKAGSVDLPLRPRTPTSAFESDAEMFNESLRQLAVDPSIEKSVDVSVETFIKECVEANRRGEPIPFNHGLFIDAVANSPNGDGPLGLFDRITIRSWLEEYEPTPDEINEYFRILNVRFDADRKLATVDLMFYAEDSQADSQQWFLVREGDRWQVYDWQLLEYGRRVSDEYAAFNAGSTNLAPGYDTAMERAVEAQELWNGGDEDGAIRKLQSCERIPMLTEDRPVAMLRLAYFWMSFGKYEDAIRPLKQIKDPDGRWGVWPILSVCYLNTDQKDAALQAAEKSRAQSPNHPRTHWLLATVFEALGRTDEAADEAMLALQGCPDDQTLIEMVTGFGREADLPKLLAAISRSGSAGWISLADSVAYDPKWADLVVAAIQSESSVEMPPGVSELIVANAAWSKREFDQAAELFLLARRNAVDDSIREVAAKDHADARIENDRYDKLFSETDDLTKTLRTLVEWTFGDDFYGKVPPLFDAVQSDAMNDSLATHPEAQHWALGLLGWCNRQRSNDELALPQLDRFAQWHESYGEKNDWLEDSVDQTITETLLGLDRPLDVIKRFPDNPGLHSQVVTYLLRQGVPAMQSFLDESQDVDASESNLVRLRLRAAIANASGKPKQADEFHREAIELFDDLESGEDSYVRSALFRQRAKDLVLSRTSPMEIEIKDDDRETLIFDVLAEASRLSDFEMLRAWSDDFDPVAAEPERVAELQTRLAEYHLADGQYDVAADQVAIADSGDIADGEDLQTDYWSQRRREVRVQALLQAGRFDETLANTTSDETEKPSLVGSDRTFTNKALAALAKGDLGLLTSILVSVDADEVGPWLGSSNQQRWLQNAQDVASVRILLETHPIDINYVSPESSGAIFLPASAKPTIDVLKTELNAASNEKFDFKRVETHSSRNELEAWIAQSPSGNRILLDWSIEQLDRSQIPRIHRSRFERPVCRLKITIMDQLPKANRRLFEIAAALAGEDAIAFSWNDGYSTWLDSPIREQLRWRDRAPITADVLSDVLVPIDDESNIETLSVYEWSRELEAKGQPIEVVVNQSCGGVSESIAGELISVDEENYRLLVRATVDGAIDPLVRTGIAYHVHPGNVRKSDPLP